MNIKENRLPTFLKTKEGQIKQVVRQVILTITSHVLFSPELFNAHDGVSVTNDCETRL